MDQVNARASSTPAAPEGYYEVPVAMFVEKVDLNMPALPPVALFRIVNGRPEIIKQAEQPFSPLVLSQYETVWIQEIDFKKIKGQAEGILSNPKLAASLPLEKRVEMLRRSAIMVCEDLFENPSKENITRSTKVVGSFVYTLMKEPQAYLLLSKLSSHDPYTLQHSVGTSVNSIILGRKVGITDEQQLLELGMGGLLHDIGKVKVKREIINKNGPLDELEWEEMRQHAGEGYELVRDHPALTERTKRCILEHHEDRNGTGYPKGIKASETDLFSRIVGLCDIYNALTTDRTYSKARAPFEAFQLMREKLSHKIDPELFKALVLIYGGKIE